MKLLDKIITFSFVRKILKSTVKRLNELQNFIQLIIENKEKRVEEDNYVKELIIEKELNPTPEPLILTDEIRQFLCYSDISDTDIRISLIMPSRAKDNITFDLEKLLESSLLNSDNPKRTEFIIVIDEDDYIEKYVELKKRFGNKLPLKIIISKQRYNYFDFQKYWKIGFDYMSPYSKMFLICSDDIYLSNKGFDTELIKIDEGFSDNVYIIHTMQFSNKTLFGKNHESEIKIHNLYKTIFFALSTDGVPTSYYIFFSRAFYEEGKKFQEQGIVGEEWTYIANCVSVDWYASILGDFIADQGLEDRVVFKDSFIIRDMRTLADHHIKLDEYGFPVWKYLFQTIFEQSTIEHLKRIAIALKNRTVKS